MMPAPSHGGHLMLMMGLVRVNRTSAQILTAKNGLTGLLAKDGTTLIKEKS